MDRNFKGLFGEQLDQTRDDDRGGEKGGSRFMHYFGWQYSTKLIADYENIKVSEAYELSTIECLNVLSYLKSKSDYDNEQLKKIR